MEEGPCRGDRKVVAAGSFAADAPWHRVERQPFNSCVRIPHEDEHHTSRILRDDGWGSCGVGMAKNACGQTELPKGIVTLVVPFAAGGATDVISRYVARNVSKQIGQSIVIENVAGLALA